VRLLAGEILTPVFEDYSRALNQQLQIAVTQKEPAMNFGKIVSDKLVRAMKDDSAEKHQPSTPHHEKRTSRARLGRLLGRQDTHPARIAHGQAGKASASRQGTWHRCLYFIRSRTRSCLHESETETSSRGWRQRAGREGEGGIDRAFSILYAQPPRPNPPHSPT
jgi:hypothetical protein